MKENKKLQKKVIPEETVVFLNKPNITQMAKMIINIYDRNQQEIKTKKAKD
ncbi:MULTISPECIES: hypothetical protein [unclassified Peribacillus]|uniref:hypothetical protein n=1 Tax=unclassified Peribacillus TaxID=2675266 RepID=UPI00367216BE